MTGAHEAARQRPMRRGLDCRLAISSADIVMLFWLSNCTEKKAARQGAANFSSTIHAQNGARGIPRAPFYISCIGFARWRGPKCHSSQAWAQP